MNTRWSCTNLIHMLRHTKQQHPNLVAASNFLLALIHCTQIQPQVWWATQQEYLQHSNILKSILLIVELNFSRHFSIALSNTDTVALKLHPSVLLTTPAPRKLCSLTGHVHAGRLCFNSLWQSFSTNLSTWHHMDHHMSKIGLEVLP